MASNAPRSEFTFPFRSIVGDHVNDSIALLKILANQFGGEDEYGPFLLCTIVLDRLQAAKRLIESPAVPAQCDCGRKP